LHCTLLNTLHTKPRPRSRYRAVIDATTLFENAEIKDYDFGECDVEEVQICEMGVKEVEGEIRYKSVGGFGLTTMDETKTDVIVGDQQSEDPSKKQLVHELTGELKIDIEESDLETDKSAEESVENDRRDQK